MVNGLPWNLVVHAVPKWQYIGVMPSMLLTPWLAQKLRNTWPGIIAHGLANGLLVLIVVVLGIFR